MGCCNQTVSLPDTGDGQDGLTYYPHVAYADNVVSGSPDVVTNYSPTPLSTSYYWAVIFTTSPIHPGVASAFEDEWALFRGADGTGAAGIQVSLNGTVTVDPVTNINFIPAGLTGVDVIDATGGRADVTIVTAGLIKAYRSTLLSIAGTYIPGAYYWAVDVGDAEDGDMPPGYYGLVGTAFTNYAHKAGIILRAIDANTLDTQGIYVGRIPDRSVVTHFIPYSYDGIGHAATTYYENFNEVYECTVTGNHDTAPAADITNFTFVYKDDDTLYKTSISHCGYDINTDHIFFRKDGQGNELYNASPASGQNEVIKKGFRWGYENYYNNKINFIDTSFKRLVAGLPYRRDPDYSSGNFIDYTTAYYFTNNTIDTNLLNGIGTNSCTQFYDNYLYLSDFSGNTLNNCRIFKLRPDSSLNSLNYNNKFTRTSIINTRFYDCSDNTLEDSMIGDCYYTNDDNSNCNFNRPKDIFNITYSNVLSKRGSKNWIITGGANADITTAAPHINTDGVAHYLQIGDIVTFTAGALSGQTFEVSIVNSPTTATFTVDPGFDTLNATFTFIATLPSVSTSINKFTKNTLKDSVIRGVNKDIVNTNTQVISNKIERTIIEHMPAHSPDTNTYVFSNSLDDPGNEFGLVSSGFGVKENTIINSYFYNNYMPNFVRNEVRDAYFLDNNLLGTFSDQRIMGGGRAEYGPYLMGAVPTTNPAVYFVSNTFAATSSFIGNELITPNSFISCTLQASAKVAYCKFKAENYYNINNLAGWQNVTVENTNTSISAEGLTKLVFEGQGSGFKNLTIATALIKEIGYTGPGAFTGMLFRDTCINGSGFPTDVKLTPNLLASYLNPIRDITIISESAAVTVPLGTGPTNYETATFTLEITTHFPHMFNTSTTVPLRIYLEGLEVNLVGTSSGQSFYYKGGWNGSTTIDGRSFDATMTSIISAYTFRCTIYRDSGALYLLHSTNAAIADTNLYSFGTTSPGTGVVYYSGGATIYDDTRRDGLFYPQIPYLTDYEINGNSNGSQQGTRVTSTDSTVSTRIALDLGAVPPPATGSRNYYHYVNYPAASTLLYNSGTSALTLPYFVDQMNPTVIFGSHTAGTYTIDTIAALASPPSLSHKTIVKFITTPGCDVTFNLVDTANLANNTIVQDDAATSYTISAYLDNSIIISDEIILQKEGNVWKILSKVIHV